LGFKEISCEAYLLFRVFTFDFVLDKNLLGGYIPI